MLKIFSISLSFLFLFQSFGIHLNDIVQIDEFIEHARFHSQQYGDNVLVFISKHYGELKADHEKEHQEEKEEHEELPFKHKTLTSSVTAFTLINLRAELIMPEFLEFRSNNFFYKAPSSNVYSEGLFQPPRLS